MAGGADTVEEFLSILPRMLASGQDVRQGVYDYNVRQFTTGISVQQELLSANPQRIGWTLLNFGNGRAFVSFKSGVTAANGFPIMELGGVLSSRLFEDRALPARPVFVLSTASTTVAIFEVLRVA